MKFTDRKQKQAMQDALFSQNRGLLNNILDTTQDFGIVVGQNQTLDKTAAALSLYLSLIQSGKNAQVVSKVNPKVEVSNLFGIDRVSTGFDGLVKQFVISLPYNEGEIEKISYNAEGATLNINVVGGPDGINFTEKDIHIIKSGATPSVIFAIGVESQDEISSFVDPSQNVQIINVDNSVNNAQYGNIMYVDPSFSSTSEIVGKIIIDSGLMIDPDVAQNLMNGMIAATGNFAGGNTTALAFEVTAFLMRNGARRQKMKMNDGKPQIRPEFQPRPGPKAHEPMVQKTDQPQAERHDRQNRPQHQNNQTVQPVQNNPQHNQAQPIQDNSQQNNQVDSTEDVPSDWFTPKVFRGSKGQQD